MLRTGPSRCGAVLAQHLTHPCQWQLKADATRPPGCTQVAAMGPPAGSVEHMTLQYPAAPVRQRVTIGAGTALKIGFFGALGVLLLGMIVSAILTIVAVALGAVGYLDYLRNLQF
jgi:hypothetical protein